MSIFDWLHLTSSEGPDDYADYELNELVPVEPTAVDLDLFVNGDIVTNGTRIGVVDFIDISPFYGDERFLAYVVSLPGTSGMDSWADYWPLDAMWHLDGVA